MRIQILSRLIAPFAALFLLGGALAQTVFETGSIDGTLGGSDYHAYTYASEIPDDVADRATSEEQREILEKVAGTTQHSATFMQMEAMVLGGIEIMPATIFVSVLTRTHHPEDREMQSLALDFSLDPATLELGAPQDISVSYYPDGISFSNYYALSNGTLSLESVEVVDARTLAITGSITGELSWQEGYEVVHDPATAIPLDVTFSLSQVVSSDLAFELIQEQ